MKKLLIYIQFLFIVFSSRMSAEESLRKFSYDETVAASFIITCVHNIYNEARLAEIITEPTLGFEYKGVVSLPSSSGAQMDADVWEKTKNKKEIRVMREKNHNCHVLIKPQYLENKKGFLVMFREKLKKYADDKGYGFKYSNEKYENDNGDYTEEFYLAMPEGNQGVHITTFSGEKLLDVMITSYRL